MHSQYFLAAVLYGACASAFGKSNQLPGQIQGPPTFSSISVPSTSRSIASPVGSPTDTPEASGCSKPTPAGTIHWPGLAYPSKGSGAKASRTLTATPIGADLDENSDLTTFIVPPCATDDPVQEKFKLQTFVKGPATFVATMSFTTRGNMIGIHTVDCHYPKGGGATCSTMAYGSTGKPTSYPPMSVSPVALEVVKNPGQVTIPPATKLPGPTGTTSKGNSTAPKTTSSPDAAPKATVGALLGVAGLVAGVML